MLHVSSRSPRFQRYERPVLNVAWELQPFELDVRNNAT
jgi:hypothetical protein